ncbi:type II toxin-antitoxin system RelE/ParE family toxin [Dinghuibacter silviterrae]|uniref:ParE-like toxin of type II ParDE toxin-antitoxin system n=1 Tax=Dinghuibacter silviterrae TaxID=1539049 RepID=A0A4R8DEG8_9BACT|nr:type II toxin-antitoxin system RelE/ParE family toxin [Dinghuibacter silviterrae]TDW95943.1 ParE-like toxin of type II ParDE toxin-antitoxin system [Dinghuibacter silviterrae]
MHFKLEIRPLAAIEIWEAFDWYELQRDGLGAEFIDELDAFYTSLLRNPTSYSYYDKPVRQGKMSRFPYVVVFEIIDDSIIVYSVFMTSQDPGKKRSG